MSGKMNFHAVNLNNIKNYVKSNVALQCNVLHAPRLAIQGAPGTGKSDIIREICEENNWVLSVKYLSNMSLEQITGIPCKVEQGSTAVWTKPELFNFDFPEYAPENYFMADENQKNSFVKVLLIDDFHLADRIMQRYLFQLLTYKSLNGYRLPENTAILLAGNRNTDKALANPIPAPVCNRLMFMEVKSESKDWLENFAFKHGVRGDITSFLYNHGDLCLSQEPLESGAWASPRAWTYLSEQMDAHEKMFGGLNVTELKQMAVGLVGPEMAAKFIEYRELFAKYDFEKLFAKGIKEAKKFIQPELKRNVTDTYSVLSAASAWLVNVYKDNNYDITNKTVSDAIKFVYDIYMFLLLFPDDMVRRNVRPLVTAGTKYLQMYQKSIESTLKGKNVKTILNGFMQCMKDENDCDYIFYELLATVFEMRLTEEEQKEIAAAKERLSYTL